MIEVAAGARSHVGLRRRANEDSLYVGHRVWVVADGMGGYAAGDVASAHVVAAFAPLDGAGLRPADITAAVVSANAAILAEADADPRRAGMGSTLAGVAIVNVAEAEHWAVFNVGDSRVYRYVGGLLSRATVDHSETEELVLGGRISEAEARTHRLRHVVTRAVGREVPPVVDLWVMPPSPGERLLICSDGLCGEITDAEIERVLAVNENPDAAAGALIDAALAAGGGDNVTVIVIDVIAVPEHLAEAETVPRHDLPNLEVNR
jgi:protein phosphatase